MKMNEAINDHLDEFQGIVIAEINKRDVTDLTDSYLDDIFEFALIKMKKNRHILRLPENYYTETD